MAIPKSKTHKKIDNGIHNALTTICEQTLKDIHGFQWLTHQANYNNFPASLFITCVFDTEDNLETAKQENATQKLKVAIQASLLKIGVKFKAVNQQIYFDTEEACSLYHNGNWKVRLEIRKDRAVARNRP